MTDQINDQISAFIDNELSADESALLVRRFERDTDSRARADALHAHRRIAARRAARASSFRAAAAQSRRLCRVPRRPRPRRASVWANVLRSR